MLDPDLSAGEPNWAGGWTINDRDFSYPLGQIVMGHGTYDAATRGGWDEIRVGDTWADVVPPEEGPVLALYEPFSYPVGLLSDSGNWTENAPGGTHAVVGDSLSYPNLASTGNRHDFNDPAAPARYQASRTFDATLQSWFTQPDRVIYFTGIFEDQCVLMVRETAGEDHAGVGIGMSYGGQLEVQAYDNGTSSEEYMNMGLWSAGTPHMVAWRLVNRTGDDILSAVLNPDLSAGEPDWSTHVLHGTDVSGALTRIVLGHGGGEVYTRGGWDELRIGNSWAEVVGDPPLLGTVITVR